MTTAAAAATMTTNRHYTSGVIQRREPASLEVDEQQTQRSVLGGGNRPNSKVSHFGGNAVASIFKTKNRNGTGGTGGSLPIPFIIFFIGGFLLGCIFSGAMVLYMFVPSSSTTTSTTTATLSSISPLSLDSRHPPPVAATQQFRRQGNEQLEDPFPMDRSSHNRSLIGSSTIAEGRVARSGSSILQGLRVLVVLVAYDFSQLPHLEEVLDSYYDLAVAGATVHLIIHATIAYPVTLIDMWNDRFQLVPDPNDRDHVNQNVVSFQITIALKPKSLRLHLVDCHRQVFYDHLHDYDLFIYSEDDIRVTPTTVASYWRETQYIESLLSSSTTTKFRPSDFNVGVVRYEYNYPANVVIDDATRHATQNVTRVYWEHSSFERPHIVPNAVSTIRQKPLAKEYVTMKNHHQGMYLATASLLQAWKERCRFDIASNRPGRGSQPSEGTQRVWMSSQMLYGSRHCHVQQVLPLARFGTLTVWHLPNKNYRRVGKYRNRTFADGSEVFEQPSATLLQAMELHLALKKIQYSHTTSSSSLQARPVFSSSSFSNNFGEYKGVIRMIDQVDRPIDRTNLLERRLREYQAYVQRGGVLSDSDMTHTALIETEDVEEKPNPDD